MAFWYKKLILAVLLLSLEIISFVLDQIGGSNWLFLVASFLLSAIGFVTTIYKSFFSSTVPAVNRSEPERQLIVVDFVFSVIQLVLTFIHLIRAFLGAKSNNNNNNECLLPLAFAVISVVFNFRNNEEAQVVSDSASVDEEAQVVSDSASVSKINFRNDEEAQVVSDSASVSQINFRNDEEAEEAQVVSDSASVSQINFRNDEEAQVVSDSASVSQIISTETPAYVDESAIKRVPSTLLRHRRNKQKVVIKVTVNGKKSRSKAMKIIVGASGVESVTWKGDNIEVTGDELDPACLTLLLRKKLGYAELVSVEEKKEEKKEDVAKLEVTAMPAWSYYAPLPYVVGDPSYEQNNCSIV